MLSSQEIERLFDSLRPNKFIHERSQVSAERQPGPGELQPAGWVINKDSTVRIDHEGITINDGALTFEDDYGATILTGGGFSGPWARFIAGGLYNNNFALASVGDVDATNSTNLPYWAGGESATGVRQRAEIDATASGGFVVKTNHTDAPHGTSVYSSIDQLGAPVLGGARYAVNVSYTWDQVNTSKYFVLLGYLYFYDSNWALISTNSGSIEKKSGGGASFIDSEVVQAIAPYNATYARVWIGMWWPAGPLSGATGTINEVQLVRRPLIVARSLHRTAALSTATGTWTRIASWDSFPYTGSGLSHNLLGSSELTADDDGLYQISARGVFAANTTGFRAIGVAFGAAGVAPATSDLLEINETITGADPTTGLWRNGVSVLKYLTRGQTIGVFVQQTSGGALNLSYGGLDVVRVG